MGKKKITLGREGEELACKYLIKQGHKIMERNYYSLWGELDIVSFKDGCIYFVEVKTRSSADYGSGLESITSRKINSMKRTIEVYLRQKWTGLRGNVNISMAFVEVRLEKGEPMVEFLIHEN